MNIFFQKWFIVQNESRGEQQMVIESFSIVMGQNSSSTLAFVVQKEARARYWSQIIIRINPYDTITQFHSHYIFAKMLIKLKSRASLQIALRINTCGLRVPQGWRNCIRVQTTCIHIGIVVLRMKHCGRDISLLFYDLRIVPIVLSWCRLFEQGVSLSLASMIQDLLHLFVNILRFLEYPSQAI